MLSKNRTPTVKEKTGTPDCAPQLRWAHKTWRTGAGQCPAPDDLIGGHQITCAPQASTRFTADQHVSYLHRQGQNPVMLKRARIDDTTGSVACLFSFFLFFFSFLSFCKSSIPRSPNHTYATEESSADIKDTGIKDHI